MLALASLLLGSALTLFVDFMLDKHSTHTIDMIIHCPKCKSQHIDKPEGSWTNPPHRKHLCAVCKSIFQTSEEYTNGVEEL